MLSQILLSKWIVLYFFSLASFSSMIHCHVCLSCYFYKTFLCIVSILLASFSPSVFILPSSLLNILVLPLYLLAICLMFLYVYHLELLIDKNQYLCVYSLTISFLAFIVSLLTKFLYILYSDTPSSLLKFLYFLRFSMSLYDFVIYPWFCWRFLNVFEVLFCCFCYCIS